MSRKQRRKAANATGPVTPEGKQKSSMNAVSHGLFAKTLVLAHEDETQFQELAQSYMERFQPTDPVESGLVHEMIASTWRQRRLQLVETTTLDLQMNLPGHAALEPSARMAAVFEEKAKLLATFERCRASYARHHTRALNTLLKLRAVQNEELQNELKPVSLSQPAPRSPAGADLQNEQTSAIARRLEFLRALDPHPNGMFSGNPDGIVAS